MSRPNYFGARFNTLWGACATLWTGKAERERERERERAIEREIEREDWRETARTRPRSLAKPRQTQPCQDVGTQFHTRLEAGSNSYKSKGTGANAAQTSRLLKLETNHHLSLVFVLTVAFLGGVDGMKLANVGYQADRSYVSPDVGVITRGAGYEVVYSGLEAVLVEQARDAGVGHAAPVVRVAFEHSRDDCEPGVCCEVRRFAWKGAQVISSVAD